MTKSLKDVRAIMVVGAAVFISLLFAGCGGSGSEGCNKAITSGVVSDIVKNCDPAKVTSLQAHNAGLVLIVANDPGDAKIFLANVPSSDPLYGEAYYGSMLADLQILLNNVDTLLQIMLSVIPAAYYEPQQVPTELWSMLGNVIGTITTKLQALETESETVITKGYTLSTDPNYLTSVPFVLGAEGGRYYITVNLKGKVGQFPAQAVRTISNVAIALIEEIEAHNLTFDLGSVMNDLPSLMGLLGEFTGSSGTGTDLVKSLRGLGWLLANNPSFLTKSPDRWSANMPDVPTRLINSIESFRHWTDDLLLAAAPAADQCQDAICLITTNTSTFSAGSTLRINAIAHVAITYKFTQAQVNTINNLSNTLKTLAGVSLAAATSGVTIDVDLTNSTIVSLTTSLLDPFAKISPSLDGLLAQIESSITSGTAFGPADINPVLAALDLTIPPLPAGLFSLSVKPLFDMPIRNLITYFACGPDTLPGTGSYCLDIETEVPVGGTCTGTANTVGDGPHFAGISFLENVATINAPADGVAPAECAQLPGGKMPLIPTKGTIYLALGDTTLNGGLTIDLSKIPAAFQITEDANHTTTDNYALWKVVNWALVSYAGQIETSDTGKSVRTYVDLVSGVLPSGMVPSFLDCGAFQ